MSDTIIQEIRNTRDELARRFHYDMHEMCLELRREQELSLAPVVNFSTVPVPSDFARPVNSVELEASAPH